MKELKCPKGHKLPNAGDSGRCTTKWCGVVKTTSLANAPVNPLSGPAQGRAIMGDEENGHNETSAVKAAEKDLMFARARAKVRAKALGLAALPPVREEDLETYALKKATSLIPDAMAEVEYQLKFGDDKQRKEAALDVLDMTGNRRRDALGGGGHTIILTLSPQDAPEWAGGVRQARIDGQPMEKGYVRAVGESTRNASLAAHTTVTIGEEERAKQEAEERRARVAPAPVEDDADA